MFSAQMETVEDKLKAGLDDRLEALQIAVNGLNDRVEKVVDDFDQAQNRYLKDIDENIASIEEKKAALHQVFQAEHADRKEAELSIVAKLGDLEERIAERFTYEMNILEAQQKELRE